MSTIITNAKKNSHHFYSLKKQQQKTRRPQKQNYQGVATNVYEQH